ncbi:MAG: hypothetical protein ACR2MB_16865 [Acidimicrobiales bacterium]
MTRKAVTLANDQVHARWLPVDKPGDEFDKFALFAEKLVRVPKDELDEARERERLAKG